MRKTNFRLEWLEACSPLLEKDLLGVYIQAVAWLMLDEDLAFY
jgi:hypothetical protein